MELPLTRRRGGLQGGSSVRELKFHRVGGKWEVLSRQLGLSGGLRLETERAGVKRAWPWKEAARCCLWGRRPHGTRPFQIPSERDLGLCDVFFFF